MLKTSYLYFFTVQSGQQSSIMLHDVKGPFPKSYTMSYIFGKYICFYSLDFLKHLLAQNFL